MRNPERLLRQRCKILIALFCLFFFPFFIPLCFSDTQESQPIQLVQPSDNQITLGKKPKISVAFAQPVSSGELFVMLDGIDITQMLVLNPEGFVYHPIGVLEPGAHTLMVSGQTTPGEPFSQEFVFSTRHYESIEKADTHNELTVYGETALRKSDDLQTRPDRKMEANLSSLSQLKEKGFEVSLAANLRYLYQDPKPEPPEKIGTELVDVLLSTAYTRGSFTTRAEGGDTEVVLTENTLPSLRRRGGQLSFGSDKIKVGGFSVDSAQSYGFDNGIGIGNDDTDNIVGGFGDLNLLDNRLSMRMVYSKGGEAGSSFGTTLAEEVPKQGNVVGALVKTDFFEGRMVTEFEYDWSEFDADTTDSLASEADKAYRFRIDGGVGQYTYGAVYKYFGPDYEVIGNQYLEKDREGILLNGGAGFEKHSFSLAYGRFKDNVESDPTLPVIVTHTGTIDYAYFGKDNLPVSLSYQKEIAESSDEPVGIDPIDRQIDMISGNATYIYNAWNFGLQSSYAMENDKTDRNADTTTSTYTLMPQYISERIVVSPNLTYNRSKDHATDIVTESRTFSADIQGNLFHEKLAYGLGGTLDFTETSDNSVDLRTLTYFYNLNYTINRNIWGYVTPVVGIRGEYNETEDRIMDAETEEYLIMLTLSINAPFSF